MATLEEGLYSYLSGYAGLTALVSSRIYLFRIPQSATLPCVTFNRVSTPRMTTMSSSGATGDLASPRFQFDAWADNYTASKAIADQIRAALNGKTGSVGSVTISAALIEDETPTYEPDTSLYRTRLDFRIWQEEA